MQTKGSRPVVSEQNCLYQFSGQTMHEKMNQGLGPCTTELNQISLLEKPTDAKVLNMDNRGTGLVQGRKYFAMSACEGILFMTGGMN